MENFIVFDSNAKTKSVLKENNKIVVAISGGSDSDIVLDIILRNKQKNNIIKFVFFDTGLEYKATHNHLNFLEIKYNIKIERLKGKKSIPKANKEFGQPFISKYVSEMMQRLQSHDFKWKDKSFIILYREYPNCKIALKWWTNDHEENSFFNIKRNKFLKEFIISNHPTFKISNKCCYYSKKQPAKIINKFGLSITGIRKFEGGIRQSNIKNCIDLKVNYRPIFWYRNEDKKYYNEYYNIKNSKCYTEYGLKRTGCVACPFGKPKKELEILKIYEPRLLKVVNKIWSESYNYTFKYYEFREKKKELTNEKHIQKTIFDKF